MNRRNFIKKGALLVPTIFIPRLIRAYPANCNPAFFKAKPAPSGGGGGGGMALVQHASSGGGGGSGWTTAGLDTTGCTLLVIAEHHYQGTSGISDNKGNTWTPLTETGNSGSYFTHLFYCVNPTVGSGHTFTTAATFATISIAGFSGNSGSPFDAESGNANGTPGSITPAQSAELFVTAVTGSGGPTFAGVSGFTILDGTVQSGGDNLYGGIAYKIKTDASAENPTWTAGGGSISSSRMVAFK